ncbi:MAG: hypothetical protein ACR2QV_08940 [Gammaproteobacteria bacterium]
MNYLSRICLAAACALLAGNAAAIDTSQPLLCAAIEVNECIDGYGCSEVLAEEVGAPTFIRIDLDKKQIRITKDGPVTKIEHLDEVEGRIIMQGVEVGRNPDVVDGTGWTISIEQDTGRLVVTAVTQQAAVIAFGACTERL